jgi:hypothetical protein
MANYATGTTTTTGDAKGVLGLCAGGAVVYTIVVAMGPAATFLSSIFGITFGGWGAFAMVFFASGIAATVVGFLLWKIFPAAAAPSAANPAARGGGGSPGGDWIIASLLLWALIFFALCALAAWSSGHAFSGIALTICAAMSLLSSILTYRESVRANNR